MKKIITWILIGLFTAIGQGAFAHTTIVDQGMEGTNLYTNIQIPHGCGHAGKDGNFGVEAQSVVFPNGMDSEAVRDDTGEPISMDTVIDGAINGIGVISVRVIQDKDIFDTTEVIRDVNDNVHGILYTDGFLNPDLTGLLPFRATLGSFLPESCARKVTANVGIANYCHMKAGVRRADIWIGVLTTVFNDPNIVSVGFWPRLVINRDLENNPFTEDCGDDGFGVTLTPSDADINATLPIPGYQP